MSRPRKRSIGGPSAGSPALLEPNFSTANHHRWGSFSLADLERAADRPGHGPSSSISSSTSGSTGSRTWIKLLRSKLHFPAVSIVACFVIALYLIAAALSGRPQYDVPGRGDVKLVTDPIIVPTPSEMLRHTTKKPAAAADAHGGYVDPLSLVFDDRHHASPQVVLVLALDPNSNLNYLERLIANRREYAKAHGYGLFSMFVTDFKDLYEDSQTQSLRWAALAVCREAMYAFPRASHFWYLDQDALVLDMGLDIMADIVAPRKLGPLMQRGVPVVRALPYVHTHQANEAKSAELIFTQDEVGMNPRSFVFKNTQTAVALLEQWQDPSYRHHQGFGRSTADALNHLVQWHPFFLGRMAVIPTRAIAAVAFVPEDPYISAQVRESILYKEGDQVAVFDCQQDYPNCSPLFDALWRVVEEKKQRRTVPAEAEVSVHPRFGMSAAAVAEPPATAGQAELPDTVVNSGFGPSDADLELQAPVGVAPDVLAGAVPLGSQSDAKQIV